MSALRTWRWAACVVFIATMTGCASSCGKAGEKGDPLPFTACDAGDAAFVRNANLAVLGRRTLGQHEVNAYLVVGSNAAPAENGARRAILAAMMADAAFDARWSEHFMDELRVPRTDDQNMIACWGDRARVSVTAGLAEHVRDTLADGGGDGGGTFTLADLLDSAVVADDISTVYRAHLFPLVAYTIPAANVPRIEAELARREDSGNVFDSAYLNRNLVCMSCHNSEFAVTDSQDPAIDRHWPMPGLFESSIYGASSGTEPFRAHAVFRFDGFADNFSTPGPDRPWGMSGQCGTFNRTLPEADPAAVQALFGGITGDLVSVYDLEASLKRGVDSLAANGLQRDANGTIADPDQAFAYLVAASIVEGVWEETIGSGLTIANYFPRNEASSDVLTGLTDRFVASHFSLRGLLTDIVETPYFNRTPPSAGCGEPYDMPNVYDPWVIGDDDPARRMNSSADGISALSAKTLVRATHAAMGWNLPDAWTFPQSGSQEAFFRGIGLFLKNGDRGFRGLDFQARLVWEDRYAACENLTASADFIDRLTTNAVAQDATVRDVVLAMKDRILNEAVIDESASSGEKAGIEAIFAVTLDTPASGVVSLEAKSRRLCGVYLSTPQFLLGGFSDGEVRPVPLLNQP